MAVDVETLVVKLEARITEFEKGMTRAQRSAQTASTRITQTFATMNRQVSGIFRTLGVGLGVTSVAAFARAVGDTVEQANALAVAAKKVGVSTDALQELRFAGQQAGLAAGDVDQAIAKFADNVGKASAGSGELAKVLQANNVALVDASGNMRPLNALLDDYADLVKNAGSEQEQLTLVTRAFGEGAGNFVGVLRGGAAALTTIRTEAHTAGQVLSAELVARAADIAPKWATFTKELEVGFQSFILSSLDGLAKLTKALDDLAASDQGPLGEWLRGLQKLSEPGSIPALPFGIGSRPPATNRSTKGDADPLGMAKVRAQQALAAQLFDLQHAVPKTIIPGATTEDAAAAAAARAKAITTTVEALNREREALALTGKSLAEFEALTRAGITATDAMAPSVLAAADALYAASTQQAALNDVVELFQQTTFDVFDRLIAQGEEFSDVLKDIAVQLARAAVQALLLGQGPFAGLFGTGAGGANSTTAALKTIAGAIFGGGLAEGGPVTAGRAYRVGERGPEMFVPNVSGQIIPAREGGSSPLLQVHVIPSSYFDITVDQRSAVQAQKISVQVVTGTTKAEARRRELSS